MAPASSSPFASSRRSASARLGDLAALVLQAALVAVIYWPTYRLQFASDAWVFLDRLRHGLWPAVATPIGYHWQPVAYAWWVLLRALFGERPAVFQAVSLAELTLLGHLTYRLGRRLFPDSSAAFLGSLLVLGSASFYEATYWCLNGNMHLLGADLYVLAVILAHDIARGGLGRGGPWLLGLTVLAAVFTHPAMITAVPVCALTLFLVGRERPDPRMAGPGRSWTRALLPLLVVAALFGVARMAFNAYLVGAPEPGIDAPRLLMLVQRGLIGLFTLQGSPIVADQVMTLGALPALATPLMSFLVAGWLIAAAVAAVLLWRVGTSGIRLLIGFLAIHLAALTVASGVTSRQCTIPAVPAALLTAWALQAMASRAAAAVYRDAPAAVVLLLVLGAQPDHQAAARVWIRAGDAVRALVERIRAVAPAGGEQVDLMLVNMPSKTVDRGMHAWVFDNGLEELAWAASPAVGTVEVRRMPGWGPPDDVSPRIRALNPDTLRLHLADPYRVLLVFEREPFGVRTVSAKDLDRFAVGGTAR
jgi:hypothetical protein